MSLPRQSLISGALLLVLGIAGYFLTGKQSNTALIPSVFGVLIGGAGLMGMVRPRARKIAGHLVALFALLGIAGTARALKQLPALFAGEAARPAAVIAQLIMFALCAVLLASCVRSFVKARQQPHGG
jgi:hypothetical protein